jgi:hypothetical protein
MATGSCHFTHTDCLLSSTPSLRRMYRGKQVSISNMIHMTWASRVPIFSWMLICEAVSLVTTFDSTLQAPRFPFYDRLRRTEEIPGRFRLRALQCAISMGRIREEGDHFRDWGRERILILARRCEGVRPHENRGDWAFSCSQIMFCRCRAGHDICILLIAPLLPHLSFPVEEDRTQCHLDGSQLVERGPGRGTIDYSSPTRAQLSIGCRDTSIHQLPRFLLVP